MSLHTGIETIEIANLAVGLLDLFRGRQTHNTGAGGGSSGSPNAPAKSGVVELIERVIAELGWGVRDEGLFPIKLGQLSDEARAVIEDVLAKHDKPLVDRLRLITINVPNPPPTKEKGRKERKDKDGKVLEAGEPDHEVPSDIDNGVEFLKYVASAIEGKDLAAQVKVLENLNIAPGKGGLLAIEAGKNIAKKVGKALGFPDDASFEQVVLRLGQLMAQIKVPDPTQLRPNDKAGWYVRIMRAITPGSFPNS